MLDSYTEFEIEFQARNGDSYPISVRSAAGEQTGSMRSPAEDPAFQQLCHRLAIFDTDQAVLQAIGMQLFVALFAGDIRSHYIASRSMLEASQGMVVRLRIPAELVEIAALPWEFMADPASGPLAMLEAGIARYLPQPTPLPTLPTILPLKVLLTGAQTPPQAEIVRELAAVQAALEGLGQHVAITIEPHLTAAALRARLREEFHIWHYVGHGGFDKTGTTAQLLVEDESGDADPLSAMELNIMLNRSGIRLVVLNACDSGKITLDPFHSIAPALIRAQIPAVVAQQFKVPEEATRKFVTDFYRSLASGLPIDVCVAEGRKAVMNSSGLDQPEWGIPVLYTRMASEPLFAKPEPSLAEPARTAPPAPAEPDAPGAPQTDPITDELSALRTQLEVKRRELRLLGRRDAMWAMWDLSQAHNSDLATQLRTEITALHEQITARQT